MILSREYLRKLIRAGKAGYTGSKSYDSQVSHNESVYIAVDRYDLQRVDHFVSEESDLQGG